MLGTLIFSSLIAPSVAPAFAADYAKQNSVVRNHVPQVSSRLIVKLRPNFVTRGLSKAQVAAELRRPFRKQDIDEIRGAAGLEMAEAHALSDGSHVLVIPGKRDRQTLDDAIARISGLANVEYVEEDKVFTPQLVVPNDTYFAAADPGLWGLYPVAPGSIPSHGSSGSYGADFETAWDTVNGSGVVVAVVDGGITPHVDIVGVNGTVSPATGNLVSPGYDFISDCRIRGSCPATTADSIATTSPWSDPQPDATDRGDFISSADSSTTGSFFYGEPVTDSTWHGTHIAGIIAAIGNNATGVIGGAYGVKILLVRALGKGAGNSSDVMEGVRWAAGLPVAGAPLNPYPAKVINLSLGGIGTCGRSEQDAIDAATAAGAVVVVAAGNAEPKFDPVDLANFVPANCNNVIAVVATARDGSRASYSNFSSPTTNAANPGSIVLAAPGGDPDSYDPGILSTVNRSTRTPDISAAGSTYTYYGGTSMASAHVAAAVALMFSHSPDLQPAEVKNILSAPESLTPFPSFISTYKTWDCATSQNCGAGLLNAKLAVQNSVPLLTPNPAKLDFGNQPINTTTHMTVTLTNATTGDVVAHLATINDSSFIPMAPDACVTAPYIAPGGTCQIEVSFTPRSAGSYSALLSVPVNNTGVTLVELTGTSNPPPSPSGGGCSILPLGDYPDSSLLVTLLLVLIYRLRDCFIRSRVQA